MALHCRLVSIAREKYNLAINRLNLYTKLCVCVIAARQVTWNQCPQYLLFSGYGLSTSI